MRQAGVLAAAGIVALETMVDRLGEDHIRAKCLADGLAAIPGLELDPGSPFTNMVFLSLEDRPEIGTAKQVAQRLADKGVLVGLVGERRFRLVTHYWIDDAAVDNALEAFRKAL